MWNIRGGEERCLQGVGGEIWETDHLEDLDVARRIILKPIYSIKCREFFY